jgi:hypothetical protein
MTLTQLHNHIDWDVADQSDEAWRSLHDTIQLGDGNVIQKRCLILDAALHADHAGSMAMARKALHGIGVWEQVRSILTEHDLWPGDDP